MWQPMSCSWVEVGDCSAWERLSCLMNAKVIDPRIVQVCHLVAGLLVHVKLYLPKVRIESFQQAQRGHINGAVAVFGQPVETPCRALVLCPVLGWMQQNGVVGGGVYSSQNTRRLVWRIWRLWSGKLNMCCKDSVWSIYRVVWYPLKGQGLSLIYLQITRTQHRIWHGRSLEMICEQKNEWAYEWTSSYFGGWGNFLKIFITNLSDLIVT